MRAGNCSCQRVRGSRMWSSTEMMSGSSVSAGVVAGGVAVAVMVRRSPSSLVPFHKGIMGSGLRPVAPAVGHPDGLHRRPGARLPVDAQLALDRRFPVLGRDDGGGEPDRI